MTINFDASLWDNVNLDLTVADVENVIYALWSATIPLLNPDGNRTFLATFDKIYRQTKQQYPQKDEKWNEVELEANADIAVNIQKKRSYPDLDPNDTPTIKIS